MCAFQQWDWSQSVCFIMIWLLNDSFPVRMKKKTSHSPSPWTPSPVFTWPQQLQIFTVPQAALLKREMEIRWSLRSQFMTHMGVFAHNCDGQFKQTYIFTTTRGNRHDWFCTKVSSHFCHVHVSSFNCMNGNGLRDDVSFSRATRINNRLFLSEGLGPWTWMVAVYSAAANTGQHNRWEETLFPLALWLSLRNMKIVELQPHSIVITMSSGQTITTKPLKRETKQISHLELNTWEFYVGGSFSKRLT